MNRSLFARALLASVAGVQPLASFARALEGSHATIGGLFGALPPMASGRWTRIILGSGVKYQKQIGAGIEPGANGTLAFYETQIGTPGGSCNPNSLRKAYLRGGRFGSLLDTYPLLVNVGVTENFFYRYGDAAEPAAPPGDRSLRLLDDAYLYDPRPLRIESVATQRIHVASRNVDATHVVARPATHGDGRRRLRRLELWHDPAFPFSVAKVHAQLDGLDPFELHVYSFGETFRTQLDIPLARVREMTRNGAYGQLPHGIGA